MTNNNCDGSGPCAPGEVRFLPLGKVAHYGVIILCRSCWAREIAWRRGRNRELSPDCAFDLPAWADLDVYEPGQGRVRKVIR